jgi:hypothetical protein
VNWTISPISGKIAPVGTAAGSAAYTAPPQIAEPQPITITATSGTASASTTVFLTPITVQVIPASVQLKHNQTQQFVATVAGDPANSVQWILSPEVGKISPTGRYTPDPAITDCISVKVLALSTLGAKTGSSAVTLLPPPWPRWKTNLLGFYLIGVFSLVSLLVLMWPPAGPDPQKVAALQQAQATLQTDDENIKKLQDLANSGAMHSDGGAVIAGQNLAALRDKRDKDNVAVAEAQKQVTASLDPLDRQDNKDASEFAYRPGTKIPRDVDLLFLVLLGGALGAFLHATKSFTAFVGNEELKGSWAWWYYLHPFLGATLALAFYLAVRGGFMAVTAGNSIKTADVSPFALTSVAVIVGMFSKNAMTKLGDVFETLFQSNTSKNLKNPLTAPAPAGVAFKVMSISPTVGPASGGTLVTVAGTGFADGATVTIGGIPATSTNRISSTSMTAVTPPHSVGSVAVEVVNADGQKSALPAGYQYV